MSIAYRIDKERGITFVLSNGLITADALLAHAREITADPDWPPSKRLHLSDLRGATVDVSINTVALAQMAHIFMAHPGKMTRLKVALVADKAFGESVFVRHLLSQVGTSVIVFNDLATACTWLGIEVEQAQRSFEPLRAPHDATPLP